MKKCLVRYLLILCTVFLCTACQTPAAVDLPPYENDIFYDITREEGSLDMVMFRVGKADAMLICTEHYTLLLDTGERNDYDADKIIEYCRAQNIDTLDAVIVSNLLTDNIGGLPRIIEEMDVKRVIAPAYNAGGHRQTKFLRTVTAAKIPLDLVKTSVTESWDDFSIQFLPAQNPTAYKTETDMSLILLCTHDKNTFLMTSNIGEARITALRDTITDPCTLVKMPHHGVWFDGVADFLTQYAPAYALISDSANNEVSYDMLSLLAEKNVTYYRTKDYTICIRSNGKKLTFSER